MRIVFMGTPEFAVPTLESLIQSDHKVMAVVTRPDKPKGRSGKLQFPPVKERALSADIPVLQPVKVKDDEVFLQTLRDYRPEAIVVVAYGRMLPKSILSLPRHGCINVHASLLPKLRGAAPIQWAVANGEKTSGVTIMRMDEGMDTGNMLLKREVVLAEDETGGSLHDKLAVLGGPMILEALEGVAYGKIREERQKEEDATEAPMLTKQLGDLDWGRSAVEIERLVRGLNPWPCAYMKRNDQIIKIWKAGVVSTDEKVGAIGEIVRMTDGELHIQTGEGVLALLEVQMEGKKRMPIDAFLRGCSATLKRGKQ